MNINLENWNYSSKSTIHMEINLSIIPASACPSSHFAFNCTADQFLFTMQSKMQSFPIHCDEIYVSSYKHIPCFLSYTEKCVYTPHPVSFKAIAFFLLSNFYLPFSRSQTKPKLQPVSDLSKYCIFMFSSL